MAFDGTNEREIDLSSDQVSVGLSFKPGTRYHALAVLRTTEGRQFYVGRIGAEAAVTAPKYGGVRHLGETSCGIARLAISQGSKIAAVGLFVVSTSEANSTFAGDGVALRITDAAGHNLLVKPSERIGAGVRNWFPVILVDRKVELVDTGSTPGSRRRPVLEPDQDGRLRAVHDRGPNTLL